MTGEKFTLVQYSISSILGMINAKQFVIPEIQRPFVWKRSQVRDFIDSLYTGYPTGYIIIWKNPDVRTKDGKVSNGKHVLIDGQQRITSLMAAIAGQEVLDDDFNSVRIKIAFKLFAEDNSKRFEVQDASHLKDKRWLPDIAEAFQSTFDIFQYSFDYAERFPEFTPNQVSQEILKLKALLNRQIGVIILDHLLDIDEVTEIFVRINSKGTALSQSDFVMSKMAANTQYGGNLMRKAVDYFCHLAAKPEFYPQLQGDQEFSQTEYAAKIKWLKDDREDIYDPDYGDMLRVSFMSQFDRSKLSDLVSLLSGRNFETREFSEDIIESSYEKLNRGILDFVNEYNFKQFTLAIRGAGFKSSKLINSQMTMDFCYMLYLRMRFMDEIPQAQRKRYIQKWYVLSTLTSRYIGSPESVMGRDIRSIVDKGFLSLFEEAESSALSDSFWTITLPQNLETTSTNSPAFNVFLAAQIYKTAHSFLQRGTMVEDLINISGDIHHLFPKAYLKKNGIDSSRKYNQIANYIYLDTQVNKAIGEQSPKDYFEILENQCNDGAMSIGNISIREDLLANLKDNAIPVSIMQMTYEDYESFLEERRKLMAKYIEEYYKSL